MRDEYGNPEKDVDAMVGPDPRLSEALRSLDPASSDAGYWLRFHGTVMAAARDELARRRMMAEVTVSELVTSWGRAVVPAAMLAAAVAAFLLLQPGDTPSPSRGTPVALEEIFEDEVGSPVFTTDSSDRVDVTFASEGF